MPRYAANLSLLFTELPFLERFGAAAQAGFEGVEFHFPYACDKHELAAQLRRHRLVAVLHNLPAGDWEAGERGIACHPDRVDEFREAVAQAIEYATALGCRQLNCLAGIAPPGESAQRVRATFVANLRYAAGELGRAGIRLLVEPINTFDVPGFYLERTAQAIDILDEVGSDNAFVQYDIYHAQRTEGELADTIARHLPRIGHMQLADTPGRHEPGTGEINYAWLLPHIDRLGYAGWIGCEYKPAAGTRDGLAWLHALAPATRATQGPSMTRPVRPQPAPRTLLEAMFAAAVQAALPERCLRVHLPVPPAGRTIVIGAGKAAAAMAQALERHWTGPLEGLVVTRYGHAVPCRHIEIVEAAHPVPDEAGHRAARRMLHRVQGLHAEDLVICLVSGGGSALLTMPAPGVALADKQAINRALLACGASIREMNCVRRHLSGIKGGRLAAACHPARVLNLLVSDVPGDDPVDIASGPTVADPTTCADALAIVHRYGIALPDSARTLLESGIGETVKPGDARLARVDTKLVATPQMALEAAAGVAAAAGVHPLVLGDAIEGEAREVARVLAGIVLQVRRHGQPCAPPCVLLCGGETTVTVRGTGRGGRNAEFQLALALALDGAPGVHALAADTDGVDGAGEIAGALVAPDTLERARALGIDPRARLEDNDGHAFFEALGDALVTGPTLTNVNDFRAILVL